jgi:two-component system, CitB family, sensor kinase
LGQKQVFAVSSRILTHIEHLALTAKEQQQMRLQTRILLATMAIITLVVGLTGGLYLWVIHNAVRHQIGEDALDVARSVARMEVIRHAMSSPDPAATIQPIAEQIRLATGASFIVVGNRDGIRYSHPDPWKIGQSMVGGDNGPALEGGQEYVSIATGTLGTSVRGKVPILDDGEQIVGVVSVGFLLTEVSRVGWTYAGNVAVVLLIGFAIGIPGAVLLARSIKRAIHGLEPEEIAALAEQRSAILGAIREGIIAIDHQERVVVANESARELLPGLANGARVRDVLPNSRLPEVLHTGEPEFDQQMLMGDTTVVTNRVPVRIDGKVTGVVASFRDRTELERLNQELTNTLRYTEELRAQAHEFANTLQAVSGMIQLGQTEEAVEFVQEVTDEYRELVEALPRSVADPAVAALLLGKRARAEELRCRFTVDPASRLEPPLPDSTLLVRVVGNLVDNALDAVRDLPLGHREVRVTLAGDERMVCVAVADSGPGVPAELARQIFQEGFSTKGPGRGIGLALVERMLDRAGGEITVTPAPEGGALFRALIPRREVL